MIEKREAAQIITKAFQNIKNQFNNHISNHKELADILSRVESELSSKIKLKQMGE